MSTERTKAKEKVYWTAGGDIVAAILVVSVLLILNVRQFAFLATTLVRRDGSKFTLFGDTKTYAGQKLERIKMVDPRFEDTVDIYGTDQVEARYLVHPAYCERLLDLEREFAG